MVSLILIPLFVTFFVTLFVMPIWIKRAKKMDWLWEDMHKIGHPKNVAGSGGLIVLLAFILGSFIYIFIQTFVINNNSFQIEIFALICAMLVAGMIALVDDIFGWKHKGLPKRLRILLLLLAAIPLMIINAGDSTMIGINFGILYPLILIPIGIIGAGATYNFLAGYNGLEASQGIIILSALAFVTYKTGNSWLSVIALIMVASLLAFYLFNKVPAKVFPGDIMTYPIGVLIGCIAILGNIEKITLFFFIPYIIEVVLKSRGKLRKESFANIQKDGTLKLRYKKIYGLEHLAVYLLNKTKYKATEKRVVYLINIFQIIVIAASLLLFMR